MLLPIVGCEKSDNSEASTTLPTEKVQDWLIEVGEPKETYGILDGQLCLDQDTYNLYQFIGTEWVFVGCLRGGADETPALETKNGIWYFNGRNTKLFNGIPAKITVIDGYLHINGVDTGVIAESKDDIPATTLEFLTDDEYRAQPAMYGSPWMDESSRMKIVFKIAVARGTKVTFFGDTSVYCWGVMETTNKEVAKEGVWKDSGWNTSWSNSNERVYTTTYLSGYLVLTVGKFNSSGKVGEELTEKELANIHSMFKVEGYKAGDENGDITNNGSVNNSATKDTMISINHRGWYQAPENTLSAYRESYNHGFKYVECDVQFTKDGVPVLLHDDTIDRTSNGSGYLNQMTYAEVLQYDFSYDDNDTVNDFSAYRGEKIPRFDEFIALCKELDLHPYIEIKGNMTDEEGKTLIKIVDDAGMIDNVSWLGFSGDALSKIAYNCPTARIVWVITDTNAAKIKSNNIPFAKANLMTGQNQVVFDLYYTLATQDVVNVLQPEGIPLEVWTVNDRNAILNLNPYVTGVTSDTFNAKKVFENAGLER